MDNQTHNSENDWVDIKVASLAPSGDWHPDSSRAFAQFQKRWARPETESSPRWIRLSMAAAILASIGLVVTLLPWHALWKPRVKDISRLTAGPMKAETRVVVPEPATLPPVPKPPGPPQPPAPAAVAAIQQTSPPAPEPEQKPVEHVGPGVTAPHTISPMSEPDYTDEARQAHIQGTVVLSVIIRADGTAKVDKVVRGLGYGLDEKAIATVEQWKFAPATKDGKPVDVQLQIVISFHLY
jgi:TonB family protein